MPKEVLIYNNIDSYSARDFIQEVDEIEAGEDLTVRVNTNGGSPEYGWGMVAKFKEFEGEKSVKVDGKAFSTGFFFCCYADNVEALDVSQLMVHRAAYPKWVESNPDYFTEAMRSYLENVNKDLESAFRNSVDVSKFEELKGVKVKDIFSMDNRIDTFLSANEAKKIGLVSKVNKITPKKQANIQASMFEIAAKYNQPVDPDYKKEIKPQVAADITEQKPKKINMTIEKIKAEHPELYAQIVATGVAKEKDRAGAWAAFVEVDPKAVAEGIKSGDNISQTAMAEFAIKKMSTDSKAAITAANTPPVKTDDVKPEETELTAVEKLSAKLDVELKLNQDNK
jgi:ATP-dependent protease ClpP protease subunit